MTSIIKVNTLQNTSGENLINEATNTVTIGNSGDAVIIASGASLQADALTISGNSIQARLFPTISSISPTTASTSVQTAITLTGSNYIATPSVEAQLSSTGAIITADTVTFNSSSLTCNFTLSTAGTYYIRVENNTGLAGRSLTALLTVS